MSETGGSQSSESQSSESIAERAARLGVALPIPPAGRDRQERSPRRQRSRARATYLFICRPEYDYAIERGEWSCSKTAQSGDTAFVYVTEGIGVWAEWSIDSDPRPDDEWGFMCEVSRIRKVDPPITLAEIKDVFTREEWKAPYTNFRGMKSILLPPVLAERLRSLRT